MASNAWQTACQKRQNSKESLKILARFAIFAVQKIRATGKQP
jgi:hypothetical protein